MVAHDAQVTVFVADGRRDCPVRGVDALPLTHAWLAMRERAADGLADVAAQTEESAREMRAHIRAIGALLGGGA